MGANLARRLHGAGRVAVWAEPHSRPAWPWSGRWRRACRLSRSTRSQASGSWFTSSVTAPRASSWPRPGPRSRRRWRPLPALTSSSRPEPSRSAPSPTRSRRPRGLHLGTTGRPGRRSPSPAISSTLDALADAWEWTQRDVLAQACPSFTSTAWSRLARAPPAWRCAHHLGSFFGGRRGDGARRPGDDVVWSAHRCITGWPDASEQDPAGSPARFGKPGCSYPAPRPFLHRPRAH